jgi:DNA-binding MarR family transcriptional regulator
VPRPRTATDVRWLDDVEQRAWWALLEVGSGLFDLLSADLKEAGGLTLEDYEVLHLLSQADSHRMRVGELADTMLASRTRLSQRIDRLSDRGLVERTRCPDDRRAIHVVLTEAGFDFLRDLAPQHLDQVRRRVFDHLDRDDVEAIACSLDKVAQYLHEQRRCGDQ